MAQLCRRGHLSMGWTVNLNPPPHFLLLLSPSGSLGPSKKKKSVFYGFLQAL